jgi:hypothetical protein
VALVPWNEALATKLQAFDDLIIVRDGEPAHAYVGSVDGGCWIGDELRGDQQRGWLEPPIFPVAKREPTLIHTLLQQYRAYAGPLRLAEASIDLPHALKVRLLDCNDAPAAVDPERPDLPELRASDDGRCHYQLRHGDLVCFEVHNAAATRLYLHLFDCAASGSVEILGDKLEAPAGAKKIFWQRSIARQPFQMGLYSGTSGIDRMVVIGTTDPAADLSALEVRTRFGDSLRDALAPTAEEKEVSLPQWTATVVNLRIFR